MMVKWRLYRWLASLFSPSWQKQMDIWDAQVKVAIYALDLIKEPSLNPNYDEDEDCSLTLARVRRIAYDALEQMTDEAWK